MKMRACLAAAVLLASTAQADSTFYTIEKYTLTALGTFGGDESVALDINDAREIVGWAHTHDV